MSTKHLLSSLLALTTGSLLLAGCAEDEPVANCNDGKCDEPAAASPCDGVLKDLSNVGYPAGNFVGHLNDPFAKAVLQADDDCPVTFAEIMAKLDKNDCAGGIETRLVSEDAQVINAHRGVEAAVENSAYRAVVSKTCGERDSFELLFSQFGISAGGTAPDDVEVIAFDRTEGVFNYYKLHPAPEGSEPFYAFYGNSKTFIDHGAGEEVMFEDGEEVFPEEAGEEAGLTSVQDCAKCHTGGGLIMKEHQSPWLHWHESRGDMPGAEEIMAENAEVYGDLTTGADMQFSVIEGGNPIWNTTKIQHLLDTNVTCDQGGCELDTTELLRPLFCSVEVNLGSGGTGIRSTALVDRDLGRMTFRARSEYPALIEEFQQQVILSLEEDEDGELLINDFLSPALTEAVDTVQGSAHIERSFSDRDYVQQLEERSIIDSDFVRDVLAVDFTRPVFSDDRCGLLEFAPRVEVTVADGKTSIPDGMDQLISAGFSVALQGQPETSPAGELLANLGSSDAPDLAGTLSDACEALGEQGASNMLEMVSLNRSKARGATEHMEEEIHVFEFDGSMPFDDFQPTSLHFSSIDENSRLDSSCNIVTEFVSATE